MKETYFGLGLMSGTSMDGVDASIISSNGKDQYEPIYDEFFEYDDLILGKIKVPSNTIEDFSIARSDKSPTFILSNLIDDHLENVTNVIRGNDHTTNSIKQIMISDALNFKDIKYAHIPLIHDINGKKLSKRNNITNVNDYLLSLIHI